MNEPLSKIQVNIPADLLEQITALAVADDLSLSNYCRRVLRDHVEKKHNGTKKRRLHRAP